MTSVKYIGMDVHTESTSIAVRNSLGKALSRLFFLFFRRSQGQQLATNDVMFDSCLLLRRKTHRRSLAFDWSGLTGVILPGPSLQVQA